MIAQARTLAALAASAVLAGCAAFVTPQSVAPGTPAADVRAKFGPPTAQHAGGTRWEYATGPFGKFTWMLDFDTAGGVRSVRQVLTEAQFNQLRAGTPADEVRATLGRPSETWRIERQKQTVWSYRYDGPFCLLFHVGMGDDGKVADTGYGPDWMCERDPPEVVSIRTRRRG